MPFWSGECACDGSFDPEFALQDLEPFTNWHGGTNALTNMGVHRSYVHLQISKLANIVISMDANQIFDALASPARRRILAYLSKTELTNSELAARFKMTAPSISRHLSVLENAGLVTSQRVGQRVLYKLTPENLVNTLTSFAFEICPLAGPLKRESRSLAKRKRFT